MEHLSVLFVFFCFFHFIKNSFTELNLNSNDEFKNFTSKNRRENQLLPIILIPGLEGSQLLAKLEKNSSSHYYCRNKFKNFFNIWINYEELVFPIINCFTENMSLNYDEKTRTTSNIDGVLIKVPGFGETFSIENLIGGSYFIHFDYFKKLVDTLVLNGYIRGKTVRAAPYDFRLAPNEQENYFNSLIQLIEQTYLANSRKVILICHSMGCLYLVNFLNTYVNENWIQNHISVVFTFSAPWSGAIRALKTMVTGDNMGFFLFNIQSFKNMEQTFPSIAFLLPNSNAFNTSFPVIITPSKNYTIKHYEKLFDRINSTSVYSMFLDTNKIAESMKFPNVNLHCIYSTGLLTENQISYENDEDFPYNPKITYDLNGDSTVNLNSLEYCLKWKKVKNYTVKSLKLTQVNHMKILRDDRALDYLLKEIKNLKKEI